MAESDREIGCIGDEGWYVCPGCATMVYKEDSIECFCEVEGYSGDHSTYRWCTKECFNNTHEIAYPMPAPHPDE